jgi:hypothetical protein
MAKRLRREAAALLSMADRLHIHASEIEREYHAGAEVLDGAAAVDKLRELLEIGQEGHYRTLYELLAGRGITTRGEKPLATLLTSLGRSEHFEAQGSRTGIYRRVS